MSRAAKAAITSRSPTTPAAAGTARSAKVAADPLTATHADRLAGGPPLAAGQAWVGDAWRDRVSLAGSETADFEPGYLAGAVDAAERAVADITSKATAAQ